MFAVRFGGHVTATSEENLLRLDKNKWGGMDMGLHEVAHNVHLSGLEWGDPELFGEVEEAYRRGVVEGGKYYVRGAAMYARTDYRQEDEGRWCGGGWERVRW